MSVGGLVGIKARRWRGVSGRRLEEGGRSRSSLGGTTNRAILNTHRTQRSGSTPRCSVPKQSVEGRSADVKTQDREGAKVLFASGLTRPVYGVCGLLAYPQLAPLG